MNARTPNHICFELWPWTFVNPPLDTQVFMFHYQQKYALTQNEVLTDEESIIILNHIKKYHLELLNKNTSSFNILKPSLRKELFTKIVNLFNEYNHYL